MVATTRPETMLGDTAVAVHPEDERYRHLIGKKVMLPLMNREIPIIADTYVDREFGTGVVKITPAHDPNDFEVGKRHNLPEIDVMTDDAHMNAAAGKYAGLDRFAARARIVERPGRTGPARSHRGHHACGGRLRPLQIGSRAAHFDAVVLQDEAAGGDRQAGGAGRADRSRAGKPAHDSAELAREYSRLVHFAAALVGPSHSHLALRGLQGDGSGAGFARGNRGRPRARRQRADEMPEVRRRRSLRRIPMCSTRGSAPACGRFRRWAGPTTPRTCALLSDQPADQRLRHSVFLGRAHDHDGSAPHGRRRTQAASEFPSGGSICIRWCAPPKARRCPRRRATGVDPLELTQKFGTDALRYMLASMAAPGTDIILSEDRILGARAFANKIWNAARFLFVNLEKAEAQGISLEDLAAPEIRAQAPYAVPGEGCAGASLDFFAAFRAWRRR